MVDTAYFPWKSSFTFPNKLFLFCFDCFFLFCWIDILMDRRFFCCLLKTVHIIHVIYIHFSQRMTFELCNDVCWDWILIVSLFRSCFRVFIRFGLVLLFFPLLLAAVYEELFGGFPSKLSFMSADTFSTFFSPRIRIEPVIFPSYASYVALHHANSPSSLIPNNFSHT